MSTRIRGRLVVDQRGTDGQLIGLEGYHVTVKDRFDLFEMGSGVTGPNGDFDFSYQVRSGPGHGGRVRIQARDRIGRVLSFDTADGRLEPQDVDGTLDVGELVIREMDARGVKVTLGTGQASRYTTGNEIRMLVDREQFTRSAELIKGAREMVLMSQLYFAIPEIFSADPSQEAPQLVFDFHPPATDQRRKVETTDDRPERLLLQAALLGVDVRILMHAIKYPWIIKLLIGIFAFPFGGTDGIRAAFHGLSRWKSDVAEVQNYFSQATQAIKVRPFRQDVLLDDGVMHLKALQIDDHSVSIGSPLGQSYNDTQEHRIDAWVRGDESGPPKHDVGFEARGPMTNDWYQTLKLLWETATKNEALPATPSQPGGPPPEPPMVPDAVCDVQVVRTLSTGVFPGMPDGEKGILEAYLRAFASAEHYIYLENQYFTNSLIADALVDAMKTKPELEVIMLVPIKPDPFAYPYQQRRMIKRVRKGIGQKPDGPQRFGVFTRWSHQAGTASLQPRIMPVYIHSKVAIVDETWATIGSANLDGFSLDSSALTDNVLARDVLGLDEMRAIEANATMMNPAGGQQSMAVAIRRRLWSEHLGISESLIPAHKPDGGWLEFWRDRAGQTLRQLQQQPAQAWTNLANVLPWPPVKYAWDRPADHLRSLDVDSRRLFVVEEPRTFAFKTGEWKADLPKRDYSHDG